MPLQCSRPVRRVAGGDMGTPIDVACFPHWGVTKGYVNIAQAKHVVVHLCLQTAATCRGRPRLPSKACKLSSALVTKANTAASQAASALHGMAILQVHQAMHVSNKGHGTIPGSYDVHLGGPGDASVAQSCED